MTGAQASVEQLMQTLLQARCEVCGAKAFHAVADTIDAAPMQIVDPETGERELWAVRRVESTHYFCADHVREPIRHPQLQVPA